MANSLGELALDNGDISFFGDDFRTIIEQNLDYIKTTATNSSGLLNYGTLPDSEAAACDGDFRKVAAYLKIPHHLVWVVMRMNDLLSPQDYSKDKRDIIIPDFDLVYKLSLSNSITQTNI